MTEPAAHFRSRAVRAVAGTAVVCIGVGAALLAPAAAASAATPRSHAVGRFLDGAAGGSPIQSVVDLHDARASNPGTVSDQNPLDVTLFGQADIPLSHNLQLPNGGNDIHVGAATQIASARSNGHAVGASGAVSNQGGASVGGQSGRPADATLNLSPDAFPSTPLPLPGGKAAALGGLSATIGAVSARAATPAGFAAGGTTHYSIAGLTLTLKSPALGGVLKQLATALDQPSPVPSPPLPGKAPSQCSFTGQLLPTLSIAGGAVTIDPVTGALTIDVAALMHTLGANLNGLPANTDLLAYLTKYLSSGFSTGLQSALVNSFATQKANFAACLTAIPSAFPPPLNSAAKAAVDAFTSAVVAAQTQLTSALDQVTSKLGGGPNPFAPLVTGLAKVLRIGVNVQPNGPRGDYTSSLHATPDQADAVVPGETIVRAIEIDLVPGQGASLALANAAAGSSAPVVAPTPTSAVKHNHIIPTGVPAGQGPIGGAPDLPAILLGIGALFAAAGGLVWRLGARRH